MRMILSVALVAVLSIMAVLQAGTAGAVYDSDQAAFPSLYEVYPNLLNAVPAVATNDPLPANAVLVEENDTCRVYVLPEQAVPEFDPDAMIVPYSSINDLREMQGLPRIDKEGKPVQRAVRSDPSECRHKHKQKSSARAASGGCANGSCARTATRSTQRSNR